LIRPLVLAGVAVLALAPLAAAPAVQAQPAAADPATADFITKAAQSDEFERREGRLAEKRARSPEVRHFGAHMVKAHTLTTEGLKAAIRKAGMTPPPPPALTDDQQHMIDQLKALHGRAFDKAYIDQQVQAHQQALALMQGYSQTGAVPAIKAAATKTTPIVQNHLDMATKIQGRIGS
jgi:putative membrane protein